eukprot:gene9020-18677_t
MSSAEIISRSSIKSATNKRKSTNPSIKSQADSIRVICRFRPPKKSEIEQHGQSANLENFIISEDNGTVEADTDSQEKKAFAFDKVLGIGTTQEQVFKEVGDIVLSVMEGFNSTADANTRFTVSVIYFEIYCEKLRDLLNPQLDNLKIREKPDGFVIEDVTEVYCTDNDDVLRVIEMGKANRASAPTLMNAESSRSHSILSIQIDQKSDSTGRNRRGKLHLSETVSTLRFGERAKKIKNKAKVNEELSVAELKLLLHNVQLEVASLRSQLVAAGMGMGTGVDGTLVDAPLSSPSSEEDSIGPTSTATSTLSLKERLYLCVQTLQSQSQSRSQSASCPVTREEVNGLFVAKDEAEDEVASLRSRVQELAEELETEKARVCAEASSRVAAAAEMKALRSTISELEKKVIEGKLRNRTNSFSASSMTPQRHSWGERSASATSSTSPLDLNLNLVSEVDTTDTDIRAVPSSVSISRSQQNGGGRSLSVVMEGEGGEEGFISPLPPYSRQHSSSSSTSVSARESAAAETIIAQINEINAPINIDTMGPGEGYDDVTDLSRIDLMLKFEQLRCDYQSLQTKFESQQQVLQSLTVLEAEGRATSVRADEQAEQYNRLKEEYDNHIQRLMMKLSHEQHARSEVEDRLESFKQRFWKVSTPSSISVSVSGSGTDNYNNNSNIESGLPHTRESTSASASDTGSLFGDFADSHSECESGSSQSSRRRSMGSGLLTMFGQGARSAKDRLAGASHAIANTLPLPLHSMTPLTSHSRERDLARTVVDLETRLSHLLTDMEATEQLNKTVLESKDAVTRSLIEQITTMTQERDVLANKVDELTTSVDQLTTSLQMLQRMNLDRLKGNGGGGGDDYDGSGSGNGGNVMSQGSIGIGGMGRTRSVSSVVTKHIQGGGVVTVDPVAIKGQGSQL